ncbi:hypothetical protein [Pantoea sp. Lij88]|uniref:hypothetical protein n=1 Tax=Pantoea sp. Lij88 TaxID=3028622 RepID=UPI0024BBB0B2|nr:hypothetical protein [Pantoea sp. Lij88]WHQ73829.1 hypothetical protein PU624_13355 [Pantoea sp. Lij88]
MMANRTAEISFRAENGAAVQSDENSALSVEVVRGNKKQKVIMQTVKIVQSERYGKLTDRRR